MHIKAAASGTPPDCVVVNVTVRSMKMHGGGFSTGGGARPRPEEIARKCRSGSIRRFDQFGKTHTKYVPIWRPVIASVNIFPTDTDAEVQALLDEAKKAGAMDAVISKVHAEGGEGGADLARAVVTACQSHIADGRPFEPLFGPNAPLEEKILRIATNVYGAASIDLAPKALKELKTCKIGDMET